jgi:hypothetical protein
VIEGGERPRLAFESDEPMRIVCKPIGQQLERDIALQLRVARAIHLTHAAGAERTDRTGRTCYRARAASRAQFYPAFTRRTAGQSSPLDDPVVWRSAMVDAFGQIAAALMRVGASISLGMRLTLPI